MGRRRNALLPPLLKWRDGRPRWEPSPKLRAAGWFGRNLKDNAGNWLVFEQAIIEAKKINAEVDAWRDAGGAKKVEPQPRRTTRTCAAMFQMYYASPDFKRLGAYTQKDYRNKAKVFLDADFADAPVASLTKAIVLGWWEEMYETRGHAMANGSLAVVRAALSYAERKGWRADGSNPAKDLKRPTVPPRVVIFTDSEIAHVVKTADEMGELSILVADAFISALHSGQREGDVLGFQVPLLNARGDYTFDIIQGKRKARVKVPASTPFQARIDQIRRRRLAQAVAPLAFEGPLIIDPNTGTSFTVNAFGKIWRLVRAAAAEEMPSIAEKKFMDLRDTSITRLALADCTVPEIRAITGHSLQTVHQVLAHYLALDDRMAASAITKLRNWMERERISI